jgi:hypothetical protein
LHYDNPREAFRCANRPLLIEQLADALLMYEHGRQNRRRTSEEFLEDLRRGLEALTVAAEGYRQRPGRKRNPSLREVESALQVLTKLRETITREEVLRAAALSPIQEFSTPPCRGYVQGVYPVWPLT